MINENWSKRIMFFRMFTYICMFIAIMVLGIKACASESESSEEKNEFWGPDWIPHPHPPQPKEPDNWANKE